MAMLPKQVLEERRAIELGNGHERVYTHMCNFVIWGKIIEETWYLTQDCFVLNLDHPGRLIDSQAK